MGRRRGDARGHAARDARVHEPGAGERRAHARSPLGSLEPRRDRLRVPRRAASLRSRPARRLVRADPLRASACADGDRAGRPARVRCVVAARGVPRSRGALSDGAGAVERARRSPRGGRSGGLRGDRFRRARGAGHRWTGRRSGGGGHARPCQSRELGPGARGARPPHPNRAPRRGCLCGPGPRGGLGRHFVARRRGCPARGRSFGRRGAGRTRVDSHGAGRIGVGPWGARRTGVGPPRVREQPCPAGPRERPRFGAAFDRRGRAEQRRRVPEHSCRGARQEPFPRPRERLPVIRNTCCKQCDAGSPRGRGPRRRRPPERGPARRVGRAGGPARTGAIQSPASAPPPPAAAPGNGVPQGAPEPPHAETGAPAAQDPSLFNQRD